KDIGASHGIGKVDRLDRFRLSQRQKVIVTLQMTVAGVKVLAAKMALIEVEFLNLGAHRAIENQDAFTCRGCESSHGFRSALGRASPVRIPVLRTTHSFPFIN